MRKYLKNLLAVFWFISFLFCGSAIRSQVTADFTADTYSGCGPLVVHFTDASSGPVTSRFWRFGNGNTSALTNPAAIYTSPGLYTVTLIVYGASSVDSIVKVGYIRVFANPVASFTTSSLLEGCPGLSVTYNNTSLPGDAPLSSYFWDFGDGYQSTAISPTHTYVSSGYFDLTLIVEDTNGCRHFINLIDYVHVFNVPTPGWTATPSTVCDPPLVASFASSFIPTLGPYTYSWTFGDGGSSTSANPTHVYTALGHYDVSLTITDARGCTDSTMLPNNVNVDSITADFTMDTAIGCAGIPVQFWDASTPGAIYWSWDFGDGGTSIAKNPPHIFAAPGTYTVSLYADNGLGCGDSVTKVNYITILPPPSLLFVADTSDPCEVPYEVTFSAPGGIAWYWDFGDGFTSTDSLVSHTYTAQDTFDVTFAIEGAGLCWDTVTINNLVNIQEMVGGFFATPDSGCIPLAVTFTDTTHSLQPIVAWDWDFGDGSSGSGPSPVHVYDSIGYFDVTLTVTNSNGCVEVIHRPGYIRAGTEIDASFIQPNDTICGCVASWPVTSDSATHELWFFGTGGADTVGIEYYPDTGWYAGTTFIPVMNGCLGIPYTGDSIYIDGPTFTISASATGFCTTPFTIFFNLTPIEGDIFFWEFGDGTFSSLEDPTHTYPSTGYYIIQVTVTNSLTGCICRGRMRIRVTSPEVDFVGTPTTGCAPLSVDFTSLVSGGTGKYLYRWIFGDGDTSYVDDPNHVYLYPGTYDVSIRVEDSITHCTYYITRPNYVVVGGVHANFGVDTTIGCLPLTVHFTDSSVFATPITYLWKFGDGTFSSLPNPTHTYTAPGLYDVKLITADMVGCSSIVNRPAYIYVGGGTAGFVVSDTAGCVGYPFSFTNTSTGVYPHYYWDFGDGSPISNDLNPVHAYTADSTYYVTLTLIDSAGCTSVYTDSMGMHIHPPIANFGVLDSVVGCPPALATFIDSSWVNIVYWTWDFGDTSTVSHASSPSHLYFYGGYWDVSLTVVDDKGCRDSITKPNAVNVAGPIGTFVVDQDTGCTPTTVTFIANALHTVEYIWDFGDGSVPVTAMDTIVHVYTYTGIFHPSLILSDGAGCIYLVPFADSIVIDTVPEPIVSADFYEFCHPDSVHFTGAVLSTSPSAGWYWDFGDGTTDTVQNPVHYFDTAGVYNINVIASNTFGCTDSAFFAGLVTIHQPPDVSITQSDSIGCVPFPVTFTGASSVTVPLVNWNWQFGDGDSASLGTGSVSHTYLTPDTVWVTLVVTDTAGCMDTASTQVMAIANPVASFYADNPHACPFDLVSFHADTTYPGLIYTWDFGDGVTAVGTDVNHIYISPGDFTVTLAVVNFLGCTDTLVRPAYMHLHPPVAAFGISDTSVCPGDFILFSDLSASDTTLVEWLWDFGDGTTGSGNPIAHAYSLPGYYLTTLIIRDSVGCRDTITNPAGVRVHVPPSAVMYMSDTLGCVPFAVALSAASLAGTPVALWNWNYGDGGSGIFPTDSAFHTYLFPGIYTVTVILTDTFGCKDTTSRPLQAILPPVADFYADAVHLCPLELASFHVIDTVYPGLIYTWDFGDGATATGTYAYHGYTSPGDYTVTLSVISDIGCTDTLVKTAYIHIHPPLADFSISDTSVCPGEMVTLTDLSSGDTTLVNWEWDFGDGTVGTGSPIAHSWALPGNYVIQLIVTDARGCRDTLISLDTIQVNAPPLVTLFIADTTGCDPIELELGAVASGVVPVVLWDWSFGDGGLLSTATPPPVTHAYTGPSGSFVIVLTITDSNGCQATDSVPFTLPPDPSPSFTSPDAIGCSPSDVTFVADTALFTSWGWDFGDGSGVPAAGGSAWTTSHHYSHHGAYDVTLVTVDIMGCPDTLRLPQFVFIDTLIPGATALLLNPCSPASVLFSDASVTDTSVVQWIWTYGDGTSDTVTVMPHVHVYSSPGIYYPTVSMVTAAGCSGSFALPPIVVLDNIPPPTPDLHLVTVKNTITNDLRWSYISDTTFSHYTVYRESPPGSSLFTAVVNIYDALDTTWSDVSISPELFAYRYTVSAVDTCGQESARDTSDIHRSVELSTASGPETVTLNWNGYEGWPVEKYYVYRASDYNIPSLILVDSVAGSVHTWLDTTVICHQARCYRISALELGGRREMSYSDTAWGTPMHDPNQLLMQVCAATVVDNAVVQISWDPPLISNALQLLLERSPDEGLHWGIVKVFPPSVVTWTDSAVQVNLQSYAYRIAVEDSCGDISPWSRIAKTVLLDAQDNGAHIYLNWSLYQDWLEGVSYYEIFILNEQTNTWDLINAVPSHPGFFEDIVTLLNQNQYCYRVLAHQQNGGCESLSNQDCVPARSTIYVPNAFTPNDDGLNDTFHPSGVRMKEYHLRIFDRWGMVLFETRLFENGWNGRYKDLECQEGAYIWVIDGTSNQDQQVIMRGTVTLIR